MLKFHCVRIVCTIILVLTCAVALSAQIITGEITGTVMDQSGASLAGASVSAVCPDTKLTRTVTSRAHGSKNSPSLRMFLGVDL